MASALGHILRAELVRFPLIFMASFPGAGVKKGNDIITKVVLLQIMA